MLYLGFVSTVAEIVEAVSHLSPEQKRELLVQLEPLFGPPLEREHRTGENLSDDFTQCLAAHFHRAKQAALGEG
jgi:hypothetical protein